jgi:asparagine synthase (glutamine-hydrolysing)
VVRLAPQLMCGICGVVAFDSEAVIDRDLVARATRSMSHRGPDDEGIWCAGNAALGFRRLSVIDLSANANQPLANEDGTIRLVCNGEIYNFAEVRERLVAAGHVFRSAGDSEVCLHAYETWGLDFVSRLEGMFALALLDLRQRRLVLVRDRIGIKPLCYRLTDSGVHFASEINAILADPAVEAEIDPFAVNLYFVRDVVPAPYTIYRGIRKLLPGELVCIDYSSGGVRHSSRRYWQLDFEPRHRRPRVLADELSEHLERAVSSHCVSDVPIGAFLSGGIDSSTVLHFMRSSQDRPIHTFTVGFDDDANDESQSARRIAAAYATKHHDARFPRDGVALLEAVTPYFDEPFGDSSALPTYLVSRLASEHVKVVLSGDGGDELLGGYITAAGARRIALACRLPEPIRRAGGALLHRLAPSPSSARLAAPTWRMMAALRDHLWDGEGTSVLTSDWRASDEAILASYEPLERRLSELSPLDAYLGGLFEQYLADDILVKLDRASSAHGLEARVPLLDHRLVSFCATIPPSQRYAGGATKQILRRTMAGRLPETALRRRKLGFGIPASYWSAPAWRSRLRTLLAEEALLPEIIDTSAAETWSGDLAWRVLAFASWLRQSRGREPRARPSSSGSDERCAS